MNKERSVLAGLPAGLVSRPVRIDDLSAVLGLLIRCDLAEVGHADTTADDLLAEWRRPGLDLASDAVLVEAEEGAGPVGYAMVYAAEESNSSGVDADWRGRDRGLAGALASWSGPKRSSPPPAGTRRC